MVFGNSTSATTPSSSSSCRRAAESQLRYAVGAAQVVERVHVGLRPLVELVEVLRLEVVAVLVHLRAGVAVGRDHDVAVTGERGHLVPPGWARRADMSACTSVGCRHRTSAGHPLQARVAPVRRRQASCVRSRSQVSAVTPPARSSCLRTRIDASVRGRSSTTSHVAREHEPRHPRFEEREQRGRVERRRRRGRSPRPSRRPRRARAGTPTAAHSSTSACSVDEGLHLERRDVLAPPADGVAQPVDEVVPAVVVDPERVAGVEPAVAPRRRPSARASCSSRR